MTARDAVNRRESLARKWWAGSRCVQQKKLLPLFSYKHWSGCGYTNSGCGFFFIFNNIILAIFLM